MCLISGGLFLFVYESSEFDLEGFILVLSASFIGGIRWTLSQIIAQKKELGKKLTWKTLFYTAFNDFEQSVLAQRYDRKWLREQEIFAALEN